VGIALAAAVLSVSAPTPAQAPAGGDALILITLDGARTEEVFGGLDAEVLRSTLQASKKLEDDATYRRFNAATAEDRRRKMMPFFWGELVTKHGSIAGTAA
jgi:hypothetical protein